MKVTLNNNKKTIFTRKCISEAILALLEKDSLAHLKISAIVQKAGVSRMTFYHYYDSPTAALKDYLQIIVYEYLENSENAQNRIQYLEYQHILYSLNFFDQYSRFFLTLSQNNLQGILLDGINRFMEEHIQTEGRLSIYQIYAYAGGLLNTFLKWEESGKKERAEAIAETIFQLYHPKD